MLLYAASLAVSLSFVDTGTLTYYRYNGVDQVTGIGTAKANPGGVRANPRYKDVVTKEPHRSRSNGRPDRCGSLRSPTSYRTADGDS